MNIIADENISFAKQAFSQFGNVKLLPGRTISNEQLTDTDILIVRSVTQINRNLIGDATIKFVGTTTIGTDHFDMDFLNEKKIKFASSPGCNSQAVAEYVISSILKIAADNNLPLQNKKLGIIGYGNIGAKVAKLGKVLGLEVIINDPPKERDGKIKSSTLEEVLNCDIITLHVPLNLEGKDKTFHLLSKQELSLIKENAILINTARGPVINNIELVGRLTDHLSLLTVLDVWENEPEINQQLLKLANITTPHIAGYSLEGKVNGTKMIYDKLCDFFNERKIWEPKLPLVSNNIFSYSSNADLFTNMKNFTSVISHLQEDTDKLKYAIEFNSKELANHFDSFRKNYNLRREFKNYLIDLENEDHKNEDTLTKLGFNIKQKQWAN